MNLWSELLDCGEGRGFDRVTEPRGEADGPQHTELVFCETQFWIVDGADGSGIEVIAPADVVEKAILQRVVDQWVQQHSVDGEVTALYVLARVAGEADFIRMAAVRVADIGAESRDFDKAGVGTRWPFGKSRFLAALLGMTRVRGLGGFSRLGDQHDAELGADGVAFRIELHDLIGGGAGSDVEVGGPAVEQEIADASADEISGVALIAEGADDRDSEITGTASHKAPDR